MNVIIKNILFGLIILLVIILILIGLNIGFQHNDNIDYSSFLSFVHKNEIKKVIMNGNNLTFIKKNKSQYM